MRKGEYKHTEESKSKIKGSWFQKGKSAWNKGLTKSLDPRIAKAGLKLSRTLKQSGSRKGKKNPMFGKPSGMKGKKHTKETKQKMSESHKLLWKHRRSS